MTGKRKRKPLIVFFEKEVVYLPLPGITGNEPVGEETMPEDRRMGSEEKISLLLAALQACTNGVAITDSGANFIWANPALTHLTGYPIEELIGQNARILKSDKQDPTYYEQLWRTILSGRTWRGEFINRRKDGSLYTEEQAITPVRDRHGIITHFIAIKQDITERKQTEQALRESEARAHAILETTVDGIITIDEQGRIGSFNKAAEQIFGYRTEEVIGQNVKILMPYVCVTLCLKGGSVFCNHGDSDRS